MNPLTLTEPKRKAGRPKKPRPEEPKGETREEHNARIEKEEPGQHSYINGWCVANGDNVAFPGAMRNVTIHEFDPRKRTK